MAMYGDAVHASALASHPSGLHQLAYDAQQRSLQQDVAMARLDQGNLPAEIINDTAEYVPSHGYYAPPQAPRLSAAAARASSMAAMYYNPTLHPLHPLNSHAGAMDSWTGSYRASEYGQNTMAAPAYHHQQIENQLMDQKKRIYGNQACYSAAATAYGQEQNQPEQPFVHRYSYPHDRSQRPWTHAQHQTILPPPPPPPPSAWAWKDGHNEAAMYRRNHSDATPTQYPADQDSHGQSYFGYSKQHSQTVESAAVLALRSQSLSLPGTAHLQQGEHGWTAPQGGEGYVPQGSNWGQSYADNHHSNALQSQRGWAQTGNEAHLWNGGHHAERLPVAPDGWMQPAQYQPMATAMLPPLTYQPCYEVYSNPQLPDQGERFIEARVDNVKEQATATEQAKSAPAPPSPETLDKSAVPISSVGAEIIWSACVVFTEPDLLASCTRGRSEDGGEGRGRTPSSNSRHSSSRHPLHWVEADWGHKSTQPSHERSHRGTPNSQSLRKTTALPTGEAAVSSEESSASSSEPGTPPSSFPSYMYGDSPGLSSRQGDKRRSYSTMHDLRGLALSPTNSTRDSSMPPLERRRTLDGVQQAASGVFNLVSVDCQWSLHEEKFLSLSQSLREGAKTSVDSSLRSTASSHRMRSTPSNGMSPRSEETQGATATASDPSPAFRRFAHQVLAQTLVSPTAFILALMYSLRVPHLAVQINSDGVAELDAEAREIFAQPPSAAPFKLFTLGLMIANKHLDDNTFLNKTWNEVTGISLVEINRMERWYLEKCSYEIAVPEEPWVAFLERLALRTESKLSASSDTSRRLRVGAKTHSSTSQSFSPLAKTFKTLGGLTHEDALKRLLLSVEEALVVIGRLAPFDLTRQMGSVSPASPSTIATSNSGNSLQSLHHDCRSAPALSQYHETGGDVDVFGDEVGPYRPQGKSARSHHLANERRSLDPFFHRSNSESTASLSWTQQQQNGPPLDAFRKASDRGAPLAPSVLLDLLNRGQHLAH